MADGVEEEELGDDKGLDQHDRAGDNDSYEADNVHDTDDVENDVARPSQGSFKERHFWGTKKCREKEDSGVFDVIGLMFTLVNSCRELNMLGGRRNDNED